MTDSELVRRCRDGDREAFNALIAKYQNRVYALCCHFAGDFAAAQDLTQETFVRVYLDLHGLREVGKFPAWLGKVTTRVCHRAMRRHARHSHEDIGGLAEAELADDAAESPADASVDSETRAVVSAAVAKLPEPQRLAVTMHYMDGLSYGEIAAFLDVPTTTIKNRLHRARLRLKEGLLTMVEREFEGHRLPEEFAEEALHEARVVDIIWSEGPEGEKYPVLALAPTDSPEMRLPIWVGFPEAISIHMAMTEQHPPRPMTHDLLVRVLDAANARLLKVVVSDIQDGVYMGTLLVAFGEDVKEVDCRPSDAIALAVRADLPIMIAKKVVGQEDAWTPASELGALVDRCAATNLVVTTTVAQGGDEED
ncbi:sigma-70 family RNA polymerase sigma factor [Candidatus Poribacteria bacterium]|nr:sigma-70 family RNA polymerase sigma factor [Candidatus Poribacteria bacterium]MBT5709607.1 sigma-70 family RNA polymerase sigma factor [Candidatus Poribacteria bacterium]MBT7805153.1 sigma-70 family RNA polymerase sigma factor [Candidatus Poribacteria bacterium]